MRIMIGMPCFRDVPGEVLEDYMRLAYWCGRRSEHEYLLAIKTKSAQHRARNAIVEGALQTGCDYLFFIDDDHVIDWEGSSGPNPRYGIIEQLIQHMEADPKIGIVGALYYHRGNECRPVLMKEGRDGGFYYLRDDEITGQLQDVAVQGGGCMLIRMSIFDRVRSPWFVDEAGGLGTDIQICKKTREAGFRVCCDTSIQIGHVMSQRTVITPHNRHQISAESARRVSGGEPGIDPNWQRNSALALYRMDAEEYLGMSMREMSAIACRYNMHDLEKYKGDLKQYYATRGKEQLARQVLFHHLQHSIQEMELFHAMVNASADAYGADIGCGSAPVTFELVMRGHRMDFIDIDGAGAYEFTKWRAKKRGVEDRCGWKLAGPYDYVFMLDSLEHIEDWREVLNEVASRLKDKIGALITNYFQNQDYENPEHVSMDKQAVKDHLLSLGIYPINEYLWVKNSSLGAMDKP